MYQTDTSATPGYGPRPHSVESLRRNLDTVRRRIGEACRRVGRDPAGVRLLPVSKTVQEADLRLAWAAGCREFGENKPQEMARKAEALSDLGDLRWSAIGHLQTNKAGLVARHAHEFQALDSVRVAKALDRRLAAAQRTLPVLVQVNSSGEASKFGLAPDEVLSFVRLLAPFSRLEVQGLMTLALFSPDMVRVRACFARMREVQERLRQDGPAGMRFDELSMGMSGDFELAIEEGATVVRVGQAIFGKRPLPDSYYWPQGAGDGDPEVRSP